MSATTTRVAATHVGVHFHRIDSQYRERTCCRCGIVETIAERQAKYEREAGKSKSDYRCKDCKPIRFWR